MKIVKGLKAAKLEISKNKGLSRDQDSTWHIKNQKIVKRILEQVKNEGDSALKYFSSTLDKIDLDQIEVSSKQMDESVENIPNDLLQAIVKASERILAFHKNSMPADWTDTKYGYGSIIRAVERVGIYIPGGTALYPSTVLMTAIPAKVAGVDELIMCTPTKNGAPHPYILAAAKISNVDRVFSIGGAQAIAAMAYGTETVPKVDLICGPGNVFVTLAKKQVFGDVGIDGIFGPTETMIVADENANSELCMYDLIAQAEHDQLSIPILVTDSEKLGTIINDSWRNIVSGLDRESIICASMQNRGLIAIVDNLIEAIDLVNSFAPEHVSLVTKDPQELIPYIRNAGMVFVGENSHEVLGDYVAGPSHVMPTSSSARYSSGLGVESFIKHIPIVDFGYKTAAPLNEIASVIARAEGLTAHALAAEMRMKIND